MPKSIEAIIKPELLIWARETVGFSIQEAAKKIGVSEEKLELWENGAGLPTVSQLRKIADVYKRPLVAFYLPEPPPAVKQPHDYRRMDIEGEYSPALRIELRKAVYRRKIAMELLQELDEEIKPFDYKASINDDVTVLSEYMRGILGIPIGEQLAWKSSYQAFKSWKSAIENLDILVFQTANINKNQISLDEMRGLSISEEYLPVILINSADAVNGRIFTMFHELVHILLHNGGICDLEDYSRPIKEEQKIEFFCNNVAGLTLVPNDVLIREEIVSRKKQNSWEDYELARLANRFSVSQEVILRRLLTLDKITKDFYEEKRGELLKQYGKRKPSENSGGPPYYRLVLRNNGIAYTKLVLDAYYRDCITISQVSNYLGAKLKHFKSIEDALIYSS